MDFKTAGFDWDDGNSTKCLKHGVSLREVEETFKNNPLILADKTNQPEQRLNAIGLNFAGRYIFVACTIRSRDGMQLIRPISARYMHQKEVLAYERARKT